MLTVSHALLALSWLCLAQGDPGPARGPLRVLPANPRYFTDDGERAVLLVGSHTWNSLQDMGESDPPPAFDWDAYLDFLTAHGHNFVRLWRWETTEWDTAANRQQGTHHCAPHPWPRSGPAAALDGKPRFDLARFDEEFFSRLRSRVESARARGIYVSVMLFEGWALQRVDGVWRAHPFNAANNVSGLDGDVNGDGLGLEIHEMVSPEVLAVQEAYVRKVIDTVGDLDNVLYEISNENHPGSTEWQYHMIEFIRTCERERPKQHPVGMTFQFRGGSNKDLFESPADWISPNPVGGYADKPPASDGRKVILTDTDHLWGIGGNVAWAWKSVCRGLNPLFMDPYDGTILDTSDQWEAVRRAIGAARAVSERLDLAAMAPLPELASTGYCLASPSREYLAYLPDGGAVTLDLTGADGRFTVEWMTETDASPIVGDPVAGGAPCALTAPFGGGAIVHLRKE